MTTSESSEPTSPAEPGRPSEPAQPADPHRPGDRHPGNRSYLLVVFGALIALVGGLIGGLVVHLAGDNSTTALAQSAESTGCPAVTIADAVLPTVVTLSVRTSSGSGSGSGEIIRDDGYILTNDHVISAAANSGVIDVLFSSGHTERATLIGRSIALDLAVIKVDADESLPTIAQGDSNELQVGQPVVALGAPLGLDGSVTAGIVSALGRDVSVPADQGQTAVLAGAIQTDAAINPGNSGGALVDCAGHLVGVNTAIATVPGGSGQGDSSGSVGIGFAIPVNLAILVADQLISGGQFNPPVMGISTAPIPDAVAERFGVTDGLFVQAVTPGGPAEKAGLKVGDIITSVNGRATTSANSIFLALVKAKPGDQIPVEYQRDGTKASTTVTVTARP
ncbi:putative serine protease PepD [Jatrophihabitans sp. GAS493]|uniref:S1C family serine protease n=1 Tax=Jatrophihabitans sp. GAS493 TaxID=1907575 RepID=UPI000BB95718|nr:trypsin-like peptidase domain-containing protein [Jatrophihabitans sp. GAS493]SOD71495.1 putative serine protease PepD [Jatrophihabitans sp. GAS493]